MASHFARSQDNVPQIKLTLVILVGVLIAFHNREPGGTACSLASLAPDRLARRGAQKGNPRL